MTAENNNRNAIIDEQINALIPKIAGSSDGESARIRSRIKELEALRTD